MKTPDLFPSLFLGRFLIPKSTIKIILSLEIGKKEDEELKTKNTSKPQKRSVQSTEEEPACRHAGPK